MMHYAKQSGAQVKGAAAKSSARDDGEKRAEMAAPPSLERHQNMLRRYAVVVNGC
ncbi:MAG: hypothetical protein HXY51_14615 [Nitrospirae bacterium]|nr:hypothetical protein [Nitrospirota bacterium]